MLSSDKRFRTDLPAILFFIGALVFAAVFVWASQTMKTDDAYIFLTYARNIVEGLGYVFNDGEYINGTTSPLFTLLTAFLGFVFKPFFAGTYLEIASIVVQVASIVVLLVALHILMKRDGVRVMHWIAPLIVIGTPTFYRGTGMETFPLMALSLGAIFYYSNRSYNIAALLGGLAVLARPDSILLCIVLAIHFLATERRLPERAAVLSFLIPVLGWTLFSYWYFGSVVPSTFGAKLAQAESGRWGRGYLYIKGMSLLLRPFRPWGIWVIGFCFGLFLWLFRGRYFRSSTGLLVLWSLFHLLVYGLVLNPPAYKWYYVPLLIPLAIIISSPFEILSGLIPRKFIPISLSICVALLSYRTIQSAETIHRKPMSGRFLAYQEAAHWFNSNSPEGASIAANEIGVLGYFLRGRKVIDGLGLVTPGVSAHVRRRDFGWYVKHLKPDYLLFNDPPRKDLEYFVSESWFQESYTIEHPIEVPRARVAVYKRLINPRIIE